jgi:hypothetical protein
MHMRFLNLTGLLLFCAAGIYAQGQTITGTITDKMCGAKHMMGDSSPADCIRECVKQGSDYALVSGDKVYTLKGDKAQFEKYSAQKVTVQGKVSGDTVTVNSIAAAK